MRSPMSPQRMGPRILTKVCDPLLYPPSAPSFFFFATPEYLVSVVAPNETGPNATPGGVVIESSKAEVVVSQAA
jgi:hypothetical protein